MNAKTKEIVKQTKSVLNKTQATENPCKTKHKQRSDFKQSKIKTKRLILNNVYTNKTEIEQI